MKNLKFLVISLVTALIIAGAVLLGVPMYKTYADEDHCLFDPIHTVWHTGDGGGAYGCDCAHETDGVTLWIWDGSSLHDFAMNQVDDDPCDGVDKTKWCVLVHLPSKDGDYYYYFECNVGHEILDEDMQQNPLKFQERDEECDNFGWYSEACDQE
ncbi:hypothetical protein KKB18_09810 [bacterium]|nr:hypothetical protein [bacterium]